MCWRQNQAGNRSNSGVAGGVSAKAVAHTQVEAADCNGSWLCVGLSYEHKICSQSNSMSVEMRSKNHSGPVYGRNGACSANAGSLCRLEQAKDSTKVEEPELHVAARLQPQHQKQDVKFQVRSSTIMMMATQGPGINDSRGV